MPSFLELVRGLLAIFTMVTCLIATMAGIIVLVLRMGLPLPLGVVAAVVTLAVGLATILTVVDKKL